MRRAALTATVLAMGLGATVSAAKPMPADYQVLMRKSIFAKDRRARVERTGGERTVVPPKPKVVPVLVGTVMDEEGAVALIESPDTGALQRVQVDGVISGEFGGTVQAITLEGIELAAAAGGEPRKIAVGQNMQGDASARPVSSGTATTTTGPAATESGTTAPATTSASPGETTSSGTETTTSAPAGTNDVLERMRRRRQQELNR